MKDTIINLITECDMFNSDVLTHKSMAPSSSIEEIAEYIVRGLERNERRIARAGK